MKHKIYNKKGFTTFELLVVIFVIALISSILIANWRKGEEQYKLQGEIQEIVQNIRKAQEMALSGIESSGQVPQNFGLYFMLASPSYNLYSENSNNREYNQGVDILIGGDSIAVGPGLEISSIIGYRGANDGSLSDVSITFSVPDGFTTLRAHPNPPWQDSVKITIRKVGTTCPSRDCKDIIVRKTGEISVQ